MSSISSISLDQTATDSLLPVPEYYDLEDLSECSDTVELLEKTDIESSQPRPKHDDGPVTWMSLPRKDQLAILFLCRLVDFLQVASLQAYVFYHLKNLDQTKSDAEISSRVGILQGSFTGAQVLTAILWGKAADASWCGRKMVLVVGLFGTAISCLGYGFATSFYWAVFWRALGGAINGLVGIIRTMIAEITVERKYQSRAFLILPMSFNVAGILGPLLGGYLADPVQTLPSLFGDGGMFASKLVQAYPFALPAIINAVFLGVTGVVVYFGLEETLNAKKGCFDMGLYIAARAKQIIFRRPMHLGYSQLQRPDASQHVIALKQVPINKAPPSEKTRVLPFWRIWTRNVIFTLITGAFYDFHLGAFTNLWSLFLSTARATMDSQKLPFFFTGGLGMPASTVGGATSILGILGMLLQIFLYPSIHARLGTLRSFQWFLLLFPIAYFLAPFLAVLPSSSEAPAAASGAFIWMGIILVLLFQVLARTVTLPASIILLNNCSPHPSVLGTIHGLGQSVSAGFRTVGPVVGGWWYGAGLDIGMVGASWWAVTGMSALGCVSAMFIYEGNGHEIDLD
ncbi:putative Major facilitator superfamily (MFS) profile domain-containing protein [Seiridium cardinale]